VGTNQRSRKRRRRATALLISGVLGLAVAIAVALTAAAFRPTDGWPNVMGTTRDLWVENYWLPQFRLRTTEGDLYVDIFGGWAHTEVDLGAQWTRPPLRPQDQWLFTTYPYPEAIPPDALAALGKRLEIPSWATKYALGAAEHSIVTSGWGWPLRCLAGTERHFLSYSADGKVLGRRTTYEGFWVRGSGPSGARLRLIPLRIVPLGLAIDTLVFACAAVLALAATMRIVRVRAWRRRRRGRCPSWPQLPSCRARSADSRAHDQRELQFSLTMAIRSRRARFARTF
jgi:hypothetical protein